MWPEELERLEVPPTETVVAVCNSLGGNIVDFRHVEFRFLRHPSKNCSGEGIWTENTYLRDISLEMGF